MIELAIGLGCRRVLYNIIEELVPDWVPFNVLSSWEPKIFLFTGFFIDFHGSIDGDIISA